MSLVQSWAHSLLVLGTHLHVTIKVLMSKVSVTNEGTILWGKKSRPKGSIIWGHCHIVIITRNKWKDMTAHSLYRRRNHGEASIWKTTVKDPKWSLLQTRTEANIRLHHCFNSKHFLWRIIIWGKLSRSKSAGKSCCFCVSQVDTMSSWKLAVWVLSKHLFWNHLRSS